MTTSSHPFVDYARQFIGAPYIIGGNGPYFDCSGLVCEVLKSFGILKAREDLDCDGLWRRFKQYECSPVVGAIAFFGTLQDLVHVSIVSGEGRVIEAGGGDRTTASIAQAVTRGAMVRERPLNSRIDLVTFALPPLAGLSG